MEKVVMNILREFEELAKPIEDAMRGVNYSIIVLPQKKNMSLFMVTSVCHFNSHLYL